MNCNTKIPNGKISNALSLLGINWTEDVPPPKLSHRFNPQFDNRFGC